MEPDAAPSRAAGTGGSNTISSIPEKSRAAVLTKTSQGGTPSTPKFYGICDGLKVRGLIFDSADSRADRFTHVKCEIAEYTGKEYTNGRDVQRTINRYMMKTIEPPASLAIYASDMEK